MPQQLMGASAQNGQPREVRLRCLIVARQVSVPTAHRTDQSCADFDGLGAFLIILLNSVRVEATRCSARMAM
jgi:hypothetical protein